MAKQRIAYAALNRGLVSRLGLAREDIDRVSLSADIHENFVPRVLGSMQIRPGLQYLGMTLNELQALYLPFIFNTQDTALLELTSNAMRIWVNDVLLTRNAVLTQTQNSNFDADVNSWTDSSDVGALITWEPGGFLSIQGNGSAFGRARQKLTVNLDDQGIEHGIRVQVQSGPVGLRIGSTEGGDEFLSELPLDAGGHSLAFTPTTTDCWIELNSSRKHIVLVDSVFIEGAGDITLATPWLAEDLSVVRGGTDSQSADVIWIAADGYQQWMIQRWGLKSWSVATFMPEDGPFESDNTGAISLTPSGISGNVVVTASAPLFHPNHVGALFRLKSSGQEVALTITTDNTFTNTIFIEDSGERRKFTVTVSAGFVGTATLERSFISADGPFEDAATYTTAQNGITFNDTLDGELTWYRIGFQTGELTAGSSSVKLTYRYGSITGICRVTVFTSTTLVDVEVLSDFGNNSATDIWAEGSWSDVRGYPTAVSFHQARLCWAGRDRLWASASDGFYSYSDQGEGDAEPFSRTIGSGSVDVMNWMLPLKRLTLGGEGAEYTVNSSSLNEPLTPSNANLERISTQGSAECAAVAVDARGMFVQRGGTRIFELGNGEDGDFTATHLSAIVPEIGQPSIIKLVVQRQPDTRMHCIRSDGSVALLVFDRNENVICFCDILTDGLVEDAVVLPGGPGAEEDQVYYTVNRNIAGTDRRYLEKWATEAETRGGPDVKLADSFVIYDGEATGNLFPVGHLAGKQVLIWADETDYSRDVTEALLYTAQDDPVGITPELPFPVTHAIIGLPYEARWRSTKLTRLQLQRGTALTTVKAITGIGLIMADVHARSLMYGPNFTRMDALPRSYEGEHVEPEQINTDREEEVMAFPSENNADARLCLRAFAPRPLTILAAIIEVEDAA